MGRISCPHKDEKISCRKAEKIEMWEDNIMKRFIAMLVAAALTVTVTLPLAGCGKKADDTVSWGRWLEMLDSVFGMETYTTDTPYFSNITNTNPYFEAVQIAAEWDVISPEDEIDTEEKVSWREALITVVNVGNFTDLQAQEEEKLTYAFDHFDIEIRDYWLDRAIPMDKAMLLLGTAQEQWASFKYDHVIEEVAFKEGVKDFTQEEHCINEYFVMEDNVIAIPLEYAAEIQQGDVYVLPPNSENLGISAYKAENVYSDEKFLFIQNSTEELELENIAETIFIEETYMPTMENAVVYDGNGNIISVGSNVSPYASSNLSNNQEGDFSDLVYRGGDSLLMDTAGSKVTHTFSIDGCEVSLEYKLNGAFDMKASVKSENMLPSKDYGELKLEGSVEISQLEVTKEFDYGFFSLKSALLKLDYKETGKVALSYKCKPIDKVVAPKWSNGNNHLWYSLTRTELDLKDRNGKGAKTIKLGSIDVYSIGVARVCLDINLKISIDGSVSIEVTESGSKGLEYRNHNLRVINVSDTSSDLTFKGKVEFTIGVGPALYVIGLKKQIIGFEVQGGVGGSASVTIHLADTENHLLEECSESQISAEVCEAVAGLPLYAEAGLIEEIAKAQGSTYTVETSGDVQIHTDVCVDVVGYFILKLQLTDTSWAAKLIGGKITTSFEKFGEKNARFFNMHIENGEIVGTEWGNWSGNMCTKTYKPFENVIEVTASPAADVKATNSPESSVASGENLIIDRMKMNVGVGQSSCILVQQIPEGYSMSDICYKTEDAKIAIIDEKGIITGSASGNTLVTVYTRDNKYKAYCAVTVTEDTTVTLTPLKWVLQEGELIHL